MAVPPDGVPRRRDRVERDASLLSTVQEGWQVAPRGSKYSLCVFIIIFRPHRLAWFRTSPFHGGGAGSNPAGDALLTRITMYSENETKITAEHEEPTVHKRKPYQKASSPRPFSVTLAGYTYIVLFGINGLVNVIQFFMKPQLQEEMKNAMQKLSLPFSGEGLSSAIVSIVVVQGVFALAHLILGIGILRRQEWARSITVYLILFSAAITLLVSLVQPAMAPFIVLSLLYPAVVFWYFTKPGIKAWFAE